MILLAIATSLLASDGASVIHAALVGYLAPGDGGIGFAWFIVPAGWIIGTIVGMPILLIVGIPVVWCLRQQISARPILAMIAGLVAGCIIAFLMLALNLLETDWLVGTPTFWMITVPAFLFGGAYGFTWIFMLQRTHSDLFDVPAQECLNA